MSGIYLFVKVTINDVPKKSSNTTDKSNAKNLLKTIRSVGAAPLTAALCFSGENEIVCE